jgi:hypothetical protein
MFSVHQHWDPLKVCAVGRSYPPEFYSYIKDARVRNVFEKIAQETEEDFQKLISKLEEFDVQVVRTDIADDLEIYRIYDDNGDLRKVEKPPMCPRDHTAMVGSRFFMPGKEFGNTRRYVKKLLQNLSTDDIIYKLENDDTLHKYLFDLVLPGRPIKVDTVEELKKILKDNWFQSQSLMSLEFREIVEQAMTMTIGSNHQFPKFKKVNAFASIEKLVKDAGNEVVYDEYVNSATSIRLGKDLYVCCNNIINKLNQDRFYDRYEKLFPDLRVNLLDIPGHADGALCPVKPGLLVSIKAPETYKDTFPGWEVVHLRGQSWSKVRPHLNNKELQRYWVPGEENNDAFHDYITEWYDHWVGYVEETVFDVNMLVIDEKNVICNNENDQVFEAFERHGITPHVINFRHRYFWDGGLHCITSDLHREGTQQNYFQ